MQNTDLPYFDDAIDRQQAALAAGRPADFWRASHWGLYPDPEVVNDSPARYVLAAAALTERILTLARIREGSRVVDVGCGFGGTLDRLAERHPSCWIAGVNIEERQLRQAKALLEAEGRALDGSVPLITADGCRLPLRDASCDHVLAIECVFHFPSRKGFLREAARVLTPGGTVALSDFVLAPGALGGVMTTLERIGDRGSFYGPGAKPLTSRGYVRLARSVGLEVVVDQDVTANTMPTYPAMRRFYRDAGLDHAVQAIDGCEQLARIGWDYHLLSLRKPESAPAIL